jgi:hypothetical protein
VSDRAQERAIRVGALVAVTLLHLPLIIATRSRESLARDSDALIVRFIPERTSEAPASRPMPALVPIQPDRTRIRRDDDAGITREPSAPISIPSGNLDWYQESANAAQAAIDAIIREEAYRSVGPREKRHQIMEPKPPPSLFGPPPKHRAGDIAENPMGYDSVWHNEHCFTQLKQPTIPNLPRSPGDTVETNPMTCLFPMGPREPRGDLFEHLKRKRDKAPLPGEKPAAQ